MSTENTVEEIAAIKAGKAMRYTEWVPAFASEMKLPPTLIHLKAQQFAGRLGIKWTGTMPIEDIEILKIAVREFFGK